MGENYYAEFRLGGDDSSQIIYRMHIGKMVSYTDEDGSQRVGFSTFSGKHFPSVQAWIDFLRFNEEFITLSDEYTGTMPIEQFIEKYLENYNPLSSQRQIEWLKENDGSSLWSEGSLAIWDEPQSQSWRNRRWIDEDTGALFYSGEFC